jgi:hypothetical protein
MPTSYKIDNEIISSNDNAPVPKGFKYHIMFRYAISISLIFVLEVFLMDSLFEYSFNTIPTI